MKPERIVVGFRRRINGGVVEAEMHLRSKNATLNAVLDLRQMSL
jgi:hypothetical protein